MESQNTTQLWNNLIQDEKTTISSRGLLWKYNDIQKDITIPMGIGKNETDIVNTKINNTTHPHGIIMGMTGSGKTVALRTFALTTAALHSPHRVQFVYASTKTIDPKIKELPHTIRTFNLKDKNKCKELKSFMDNLIETRMQDLNEDDKRSVILLIEEPAGSASAGDCYDTIMTIMRQTREINIHCVLVAQNPKSVHASVYDNTGWTLMFNNIVSHPYQEILDGHKKIFPLHYETGSGYLIEQHRKIAPVTVFDTTKTQWELQYDDKNNCPSLDDFINNINSINNEGNDTKTFFISIDGNEEFHNELCEVHNLKKINVYNDIFTGDFFLDPFFFTQDAKYIAEVLTLLIIKEANPNKEYAFREIVRDIYPHPLFNEIYNHARNEKVNTSFEAIFGKNIDIQKINPIEDEDTLNFIKNKMSKSASWRSIFTTANLPSDSPGIDAICDGYNGILFVFDSDVSEIIDIEKSYWTYRMREKVSIVSMLYKNIAQYVYQHGGNLLIEDDKYEDFFHYLDISEDKV